MPGLPVVDDAPALTLDAAPPAVEVVDAAVPEPTGPEEIITAELAIPDVAPGQDITVCVTRRLPNDVPVKAVEVRGVISPGSHHFIVDRSPIDVEIPVPVPCIGLSGTDQSRVLVAETHETRFALPPGVAFTLRPQQNLTLELHYFNYDVQPIDVDARIEFVLAADEDGALEEAGMVFIGNPVIALAPGLPGRIEFFGVPMGTPEVPINVFAMTSHMHRLGQHAWIERVPSAVAPPGEVLHETFDWEAPPLDMYDPPLAFTGQDGLRLVCEYFNDTAVPVTFGTRSVDEMCFMWLYYYPNIGPLF